MTLNFPAHIPNESLSVEMIPEADGDISEVLNFAHTFYAFDNVPFADVAHIANVRRASTLTEARACLFFERRRIVHSPEAGDDPERQAWMRELVKRIRMFVVTGQLE